MQVIILHDYSDKSKKSKTHLEGQCSRKAVINRKQTAKRLLTVSPSGHWNSHFCRSLGWLFFWKHTSRIWVDTVLLVPPFFHVSIHCI